MINLKVNGKDHAVDVAPDTPLLWVIRESIGLTGTKFGCGMAQCGACCVHLDGESVRSCVTPVSRAEGKSITTIEGLSTDLSHPLQRAWIEHDVVQCGYCQSGQLMSAAVLLRENPNPTDQDIDDAMTGNICRCGTYQRIRAAIHTAARMMVDLPLPVREGAGGWVEATIAGREPDPPPDPLPSGEGELRGGGR
jgi:isoquinoline 1-oxidoreductase subunit alpha